MFNFKYEIKTNDDGRLYVSPDKNQVDHPEHKYMAIEITRYLLFELLKDNDKNQELSDADAVEIAKSGYLLEQISDRIGKMIAEQNNAINDLGLDVKDE